MGKGGWGGNHLQGKRTIFREHAPFARRQSHLQREKQVTRKKNNLQREGNHLQIEEKYLKGEGNICNEKELATKKREPFALRVVGRLNHLLEEEGKGTICRKREPYSARCRESE